jgi:ABC-type multidrug transport system permease subunit
MSLSKSEARFQLNALGHAFQQQWRQTAGLKGFLSPVIGTLGPAAVIGYLAGQSDDPAVISYLFVGSVLSVIWNNGIFRTGWSLAEEHSAGTIDLMMTTRTPLALIMLGKTLAFIALGLIAGLVTFVILLAITGQIPPVENAALLLVSGLMALIAVIVSSFFFAPFAFLAGVRGGFFNAIMPFGVVVGGFLYPIDLLPGSLEVLARFLPTAWAMQATIDSLEGVPTATVALDLIAALGLSGLLLLISSWLFLEVEQRARMSGNLGAV